MGPLGHPPGCGCAVCRRHREAVAADPRAAEMAAVEDPRFEQPADPVPAEPGADGPVGADGADGRDGRDGRDGVREVHHHHHTREHTRHTRTRVVRRRGGVVRFLVVGLVLVWVVHSFYPGLDVPLVPGVACTSSSSSTAGSRPAVTAASLQAEPAGLGSTLGGLAQDTIGTAVRKIVLGIGEGLLHVAGETVRAMVAAPPSLGDMRAGLTSDFETVGRVVGFVVGGLAGHAVAWQEQSSTAALPAGAGCGCPTTAVPAAAGPGLPELTAEQSRNAWTIIGQVQAAGVPTRGLVVAVAAASQESGLRNLHYGDRDSQGLFQMRPSKGWGTVAEVTDPVFAARTFFARLKAVPGWELMSVTAAAQAVERSAFPQAYAQWEARAW
jgi:hypothetical protein